MFTLKVKGLLIFIPFLLQASIILAQADQKAAEPPALYKQLYSLKYTFLGFGASAEFRLQKRTALNVETSISMIPALSAAAGKTFTGLDMLFLTSPNPKLTLEPKYFLNKRPVTDNNSYNLVSLAFTCHF